MKVTKRSKGDSAEKASTGNRTIVNKDFIEFGTPQAWRADITVGDTLASISEQVESVAGTTPVIARHEEPRDAYSVYKLSPLFEPILNALISNVYGSGYNLVPILDPDTPESYNKVAEILAFEKSGDDLEGDYQPTEEEISGELDRIRRRIRNEKLALDRFYANCCADMTYQRLCILRGQDLEIIGDAYWEVQRDVSGRPARLLWVPAWSILATPQTSDQFAVNELIKVSPVRWEMGKQVRRFRAYVQVDPSGNVVAKYKEYGDPRCMSRKTGKYYMSIEEMRSTDGEEESLPATELLSFTIPSASSYTYGKPSWTGVYPNLKGARDLEEENMGIITDQKIPQMFILVSGGRGISQKDIDRLQHQITEKSQAGKKGIYLLHAKGQTTSSGGISAAPTMKLERTKSEQHEDALGLKYLKHSYDQVRHAYRMPKVALGDEEGTASDQTLPLLRFTESQVYDPRRDLIDDREQSTLLRDLGIQCVVRRSRSRVPKDPNELTDMISTLVTAGVLTPDEARKLAGDIFNMEFKDLIGAWSKIPARLLTSILQTKNQLVAAALLSDEKELMTRLQEALTGSLAGATAASESINSNSQQNQSSSEESNNGPTSNSAPKGPESGVASSSAS